jgi:hypothetical protein
MFIAIKVFEMVSLRYAAYSVKRTLLFLRRLYTTPALRQVKCASYLLLNFRGKQPGSVVYTWESVSGK